MTASAILMFIKMVDKETHATDLLDGKLYLNRISWFKEQESEDASPRFDSDEGLSAIRMSRDGTITLCPEDNPANEITITADHLIGPVRVESNYLSSLSGFCLHAVHSGNIDIDHISESNMGILQEHLKVDPACYEFGKYAVIIKNPQEFVERVMRSAKNAGYKVWCGMVNYDEPPELGSQFPDIAAVFRKHPRFGYQREYRIVFDTRIIGDFPITLDIGSIRDIAMPMLTEDINGPNFLGGRLQISRTTLR